LTQFLVQCLVRSKDGETCTCLECEAASSESEAEVEVVEPTNEGSESEATVNQSDAAEAEDRKALHRKCWA
jgi:hypothetical protein